MTNHLNEEHIRVAAYYLWENAGRPEGMEMEFWKQACDQLNCKNWGKKSCCKSAAKAASKKNSSAKLSSNKQPSAAKPVVMAKAFYGIKK